MREMMLIGPSEQAATLLALASLAPCPASACDDPPDDCDWDCAFACARPSTSKRASYWVPPPTIEISGRHMAALWFGRSANISPLARNAALPSSAVRSTAWPRSVVNV